MIDGYWSHLEGDDQVNLVPDLPDVFGSEIAREPDLREIWKMGDSG